MSRVRMNERLNRITNTLTAEFKAVMKDHEPDSQETESKEGETRRKGKGK